MAVGKPSKLFARTHHVAILPREVRHAERRAALSSVTPVDVGTPTCSPRCLLARTAPAAITVDGNDLSAFFQR
jgi:hypothetical protein